MTQDLGVQGVYACVWGSGWFDLGLGGWEGFPEMDEERTQVSALLVALGSVAQRWALLVVIPMEMTEGCRLPAKEAGSWGRRSWVHTQLWPLTMSFC